MGKIGAEQDWSVLEGLLSVASVPVVTVEGPEVCNDSPRREVF
jgi:hypothetical protein